MGKSKKKVDLKSAKMLKNMERSERKAFAKERNREKDYSCKEERDFCDTLRKDNWNIRYMASDGNCLFRSLADQFYKDVELHSAVRSLVVQYISNHRDHFANFMEDDESIDDYMDRMRDSKEWGGHQEIYAASQLFATTITVYQQNTVPLVMVAGPSSSSSVTATADDDGFDQVQGKKAKKGNKDLRKHMAISMPTPRPESGRGIHISYHGECHYNSLEPIDRKLFMESLDALACVAPSYAWEALEDNHTISSGDVAVELALDVEALSIHAEDNVKSMIASSPAVNPTDTLAVSARPVISDTAGDVNEVLKPCAIAYDEQWSTAGKKSKHRDKKKSETPLSRKEERKLAKANKQKSNPLASSSCDVPHTSADIIVL